MSPLSKALEGWNPAPVGVTGVIGPWPAEAFSRALDLPVDLAEGDVLPPMWHWFHLLDAPARSALGEDGHPADGAFLPPIPDRRRMFAGARVRWHDPIRIGDEVTRTSTLHEVQVKQGRSGEMAFVTVRSEFTRGDRLLLIEDQDIVYRSQPAVRRDAQGGPAAAQGFAGGAVEPAEPAPGTTRITLDTDPELLFRMSALTYNTHRIHYDLPYCTDVEGYPGLVVHGPLLALLLLEIPRRSYSGHPVESFEFRLIRPVFSGQRVIADGYFDDRLYPGGHVADGRLTSTGALALSAGAEGCAPSIVGSAVLEP